MLLVVIYDSYLPSAVELKFVSVTISAAGGGTHNLSVEITHEQSSMKFGSLKIFPDMLYVETSGTGMYLITLWNIQDKPKAKTRKLLRNSKAVIPGLSGGEKYKLYVKWRVEERTKASIKTFVVTPP